MFHLVVTCVASKNYGGPSIKDTICNMLNKDIQNDIEILFLEWKKALEQQMGQPSNISQAQNIYKGPMWNASVDAFNAIEGEKKLWIISCGFGLINRNDNICGYHATFKSSANDSIYNKHYFTTLKRIDVNRNWWDLLTKNRIIETNRPNSIHKLINESTRDDIVVIAAGYDYYNATYNDLSQIRISDNFPKLRLIGTFNSNIPTFLESYILKLDLDRAELLKYLINKYQKCNQNQINPMIAKDIIEKYNQTGELEHSFP